MEAKLVVLMATFALIFLGNNQNCYVEAKDFIVGDDQGWHIPESQDFYSSWASENTFSVGDTLVFNFGGIHTVAVVDKDSFDKCNITNTISVIRESPARIPLKSTGQFHFICTVPGHCLNGQRLAINVTASGNHGNHHPAPAPAPGPSLASAASSLPPPIHLGIFASFSLALVFVLGFFY